MLPLNWTKAKLGELVTLKTGPFGSALHKSDYLTGGVPVINPTHIKNGKIIPSPEVTVSPVIADRLSEYRLDIDDVVMGRRGEMGRCALVSLVHKGWLCGTGSVIVKPTKALNPKYLQRFLTSPVTVTKLNGDSVGSTMVNLNQGVVLALEARLPPLAEQKRIADKLDTVLARVDACRERLNRVPLILKRFRQSVLAVATSGKLTADWRIKNDVTDPWRITRLDDIADIKGGVTKDSNKQSQSDEDVPYLRVANVQRGYLDLDEIKTIRIPSAKIEDLLLQNGDILFNEGGDLDKVGRGWIWEGQINRCSFQNHVFRARLFDKNDQPRFISWWGNSRGLEYFIRAGKQTTNLASINKTVLSNLPISMPSSEEQHEIVRRVETLFAFADRLEARLATALTATDRLTPALLAKAFRGELVPQDPNDEPAAELLKRLAAARTATSDKPRRGRAAKVEKRPSDHSSPACDS